MRCRFVREIFQNKENGYCVFAYRTEDNNVPSAARSSYYRGQEIEFTAVGNSLPATDSIEVELYGKWAKGKHGLQLQVERYEELLPQTLEGIRGYLASGMVKGIGPKTAELITNRFGLGTFEVLDREPEKLLMIKGITEKKLQTILFSYRESHAMRDLTAYLSPFKISNRKIQKIYEEYGKDALDMVRNNPFSLCRISGFGFLTVDGIARANSCRLNDPLRIEGCIDYCMDIEMQEGHLYQESNQFTDTVYKQLNEGFGQEVVSEREISNVIYCMAQSGSLVVERGAIYPVINYRNEKETAEIIAQILAEDAAGEASYSILIAEAQKELGILLSEKQAESIQMVFSHKFSIITGGPGTGKTTVQKVLLYVYEKLGGQEAMLMAPTGRASRRMAESTGMEASTMHSALGLIGDDEDYEPELSLLDGDFLILDEQSMVDMRLASVFFHHIRKGSRIVLIGDVNQLPSVGPGNVFREMIQCGIVPVTVLDMVFRQEKNSRIATNAHLMQVNNAILEYGTDFVFCSASSDKEAADLIKEIYIKSVDRVGLENVQILTPYRKRGEASVNALNERLREEINPEEKGKAQMKVLGKIFRVGDKIIQNRNKRGISNGDIGFIREIVVDEDDMETVKLEFSDGRRVEYNAEEMEMIEHSYATTIHKSQGSEYPVVILPWLPMFYKMLKRNILYTAITRAQAQVFVIGNKRSVTQAIHSPQINNRNTRLGERIIKTYNHLLEARKDKDDKKDEYDQLVMNL